MIFLLATEIEIIYKFHQWVMVCMTCYIPFLLPSLPRPCRYNMKPRILIQKSQNLAIAFKFMTDVEKIALVNIGESSPPPPGKGSTSRELPQG